MSLLERIRIGRRFDATRQPLGLLQRWYAAQPTQRIVIAVLELDVSPSDDALEQAVRMSCARHPSALGVCEERSPTRLRLRPLSAADPVPFFSQPGADAWQLATVLVHMPFAPGAPLFRFARAAGGGAIVCAFDHLICDGVSVGMFATELACALAGLPLPAAKPGDAAALDARLDLRPSAAQLLRAALGQPSPLPLPLPRVSAPLRTRILPFQLPCQPLLARARAHEVTLHTLLGAAALMAAAEVLGPERGRMRLHTPISLRARCQPEPHGLGVFIASADSDLEPNEPLSVWPLAQRLLRELTAARENAPRTWGLLAFAGDLTTYAARLDARAHGRTATVEVSNVGRLQGVPTGARVWLTQGAHYHGALFILTLATSDGTLRACLSYPDPLVTSATAERFVNALRAQLEPALGRSSS